MGATASVEQAPVGLPPVGGAASKVVPGATLPPPAVPQLKRLRRLLYIKAYNAKPEGMTISELFDKFKRLDAAGRTFVLRPEDIKRAIGLSAPWFDEMLKSYAGGGVLVDEVGFDAFVEFLTGSANASPPVPAPEARPQTPPTKGKNKKQHPTDKGEKPSPSTRTKSSPKGGASKKTKPAVDGVLPPLPRSPSKKPPPEPAPSNKMPQTKKKPPPPAAAAAAARPPLWTADEEAPPFQAMAADGSTEEGQHRVEEDSLPEPAEHPHEPKIVEIPTGSGGCGGGDDDLNATMESPANFVVEEPADDDDVEPTKRRPPLPRTDSKNELATVRASPLARRPGRPLWRKREVVLQERIVQYTTVDADGAVQELVETERTSTEVVHLECKETGEFAHRETSEFEQLEEFNKQLVAENRGNEEYYHLKSAEDEVEFMESSGMPNPNASPPQQQEQQQQQQEQRPPEDEQEDGGFFAGAGHDADDTGGMPFAGVVDPETGLPQFFDPETGLPYDQPPAEDDDGPCFYQDGVPLDKTRGPEAFDLDNLPQDDGPPDDDERPRRPLEASFSNQVLTPGLKHSSSQRSLLSDKPWTNHVDDDDDVDVDVENRDNGDVPPYLRS